MTPVDEPPELSNIQKDKLEEASQYLQHTFRGRVDSFILYRLLDLEGIVWSVMDILRITRIKWAHKISTRAYGTNKK